MTEDFPHI